MNLLYKERLLSFWAGRLVQKYKDLDFSQKRYTDSTYVYDKNTVSDFLETLKWFVDFDCSAHIYYRLDENDFDVNSQEVINLEKQRYIKIGICFDTEYERLKKQGYTFFE